MLDPNKYIFQSVLHLSDTQIECALVQIQLMKLNELSESEKASQTCSVELATSHTSFQGLSVYVIPQKQQVCCALISSILR